MSDMLDWELNDMFNHGLFAFPVYEQNSARRVVRYLLKRGVPDEEIASAIQGSTIDLHAWLKRGRGRPMFGEWAIAWMNETRETHRHLQRPITCRNGSVNDSDTWSRESASDSGSDSDSDSDCYFRSKHESDQDSISGFSGSTIDFHSDREIRSDRKRVISHDDVIAADSFRSVRSFDVIREEQTIVRSCHRQVAYAAINNSSDSGNGSGLSSARSRSSFRRDALTRDDHEAASRDALASRDQCSSECKCKLSHYIRREVLS